jgi:hypothetical protein
VNWQGPFFLLGRTSAGLALRVRHRV